MTIISPSILAADFMNLGNDLKNLEKSSNTWLHLDVMDGHFVPNLTFGIPIIKQLKKVTPLPLDLHLMVTNPLFYIEELKNVGLHNITFHLEAVENTLELVLKAKEYYKSVGISIKPGTDIEKISNEILKEVDLILIMSVEPGFGGQKFIPNALTKSEKLVKIRKQKNYQYTIQIDGGINAETAPQAIAAGCDNLVAGSYVFNNNKEDYITAIESLRK